jgi:hypothetical protein
MDTNEPKRGYKRYEARVLNSEDLHEIMQELPRLLEDAEKHNRTMVVEVWIEPHGLAIEMARHWRQEYPKTS